MFANVHVILPFSDVAPAEAIRASLAPFQRGGKDDLPAAWLTFHDETEHVCTLHAADFVFSVLEGGGTRIEGGDHWYLDLRAVKSEMARRGLRRWRVRFADIEPDLDAFCRTYVETLKRHPATGGYGRWLNPLGRWDWWDLGGRFDGRIVGERRRPDVRTVSAVSSGPDRGRSLLAGVADAFTRELGSQRPVEIVVEADNNIEMVSRLVEDAEAGLDHAFPGAVLLPPGSIEDRLRWLRAWPDTGPVETLAWLELPDTAAWRDVVTAAYRRFPDHWAAGVAYHL